MIFLQHQLKPLTFILIATLSHGYSHHTKAKGKTAYPRNNVYLIQIQDHQKKMLNNTLLSSIFLFIRMLCPAVPEVMSGARSSQFVPKVPVWQTHLHSVPERTALPLLGHGEHLQVSNSSMYCSRAFLRFLLFVAAQGIPRTRSMMGSTWTNTDRQLRVYALH